MKKVSAIIPAYNEEATIQSVIQVVLESGQIDEVIVVDDGSTDATAKLAGASGAKVISIPVNKGKGFALATGLKHTSHEIALFVDADLVGLQPHHIAELVNPVLNREAEMTVGKFQSGEFWTTLSQHITPFLSGQRALQKEAVSGFKNMEQLGFGVETALTLFFRKNNLPMKTVPLENLHHVVKERKFGFFRGFYLRMKMYWQIIRVFF